MTSLGTPREGQLGRKSSFSSLCSSVVLLFLRRRKFTEHLLRAGDCVLSLGFARSSAGHDNKQ